jgi:hypothetical protein
LHDDALGEVGEPEKVELQRAVLAEARVEDAAFQVARDREVRVDARRTTGDDDLAVGLQRDGLRGVTLAADRRVDLARPAEGAVRGPVGVAAPD